MRCDLCAGPCKAQPAHRAGHVRQTIAHTTDGPLTPFVLISRAMDLAHKEGAALHAFIVDSKTLGTECTAIGAEDIANGLYEELEERGWIVAEDDVLEGMPAETEFTGS